jgi:hypothetical protein
MVLVHRHLLNEIYIPSKFHVDISYSFRVMSEQQQFQKISTYKENQLSPQGGANLEPRAFFLTW